MNELVSIAIAFLIGSVPFGLLLGYAAGLGDIRKQGSGNIGATNMLRTGRKDIAAATLVLDALKGAAAVWIAYALRAEPSVAALVAVAGHCFTPWLRFKGGKGVATSLGALLALSFVVGGIACLSWLAVFFLTRISSLSALVALGLAPFVMWIVDGILPGTMVLLIAALVWFRHQANIQRLARGVEPKSNFGSKP